MMKALPTFQSRITRILFVVATLFLGAMLIFLLSVRSFLASSLTEEYLQSLGRFVNEDIRYVLLVRDPVTTRDYVEGLSRFPWINNVRLHDSGGVLVASIGEGNWEAPLHQYPPEGEVHTVADQVHLIRRLNLRDTSTDSDTGAYLHLSIRNDAFRSMVEQMIYLLVTGIGVVSLGLFLVSSHYVRHASQVVSQLATDIQSIDPERGELLPISRETNIREFAAVQSSFNALVGRVEQHNVELERRIASRTRDLASALEGKEISEAIRSSLVMNLSHDLKTPLTASSGYIDHALEELAQSRPDLAVLRRALSGARASGRTLTEEVNTLLQYSITDDDLTHIDLERIDIKRLIDTAIESSAAARESAGNTIEFSYSGPGTLVTAGRLVRHIVDNLLSNANRYCSHGRIVVTARITDAFVLTVSDTGSGIPIDERERIFEPHFRSAVNDAIGPKGMGIGLALTKTWVDHLGGTIALDPSVDVTRFRVILPVAPD